MDNYNYRATVSLTFRQHYDVLIFLIHQRKQVFFVLLWEEIMLCLQMYFFLLANLSGIIAFDVRRTQPKLNLGEAHESG